MLVEPFGIVLCVGHVIDWPLVSAFDHLLVVRTEAASPVAVFLAAFGSNKKFCLLHCWQVMMGDVLEGVLGVCAHDRSLGEVWAHASNWSTELVE